MTSEEMDKVVAKCVFTTLNEKLSTDEPYHPIEVRVYEDGAVAFSEQDGDDFIYLYPDQASAIAKMLMARVGSK